MREYDMNEKSRMGMRSEEKRTKLILVAGARPNFMKAPARPPGGKVLSSKTKPTANRAAAAFRLAAHGLHRSHSALGAFLRRKKAQLGKPQAITAPAHKLTRLFYFMLKNGTAYVDAGQEDLERCHRARAGAPIRRHARARGHN